MSENPFAFPVSSIDGFTQYGMELRDWFAGQFLVGAASENVPLPGVRADAGRDEVDEALRQYWGRSANAAYIAADAMLLARSTPTAPATLARSREEAE